MSHRRQLQAGVQSGSGHVAIGSWLFLVVCRDQHWVRAANVRPMSTPRPLKTILVKWTLEGIKLCGCILPTMSRQIGSQVTSKKIAISISICFVFFLGWLAANSIQQVHTATWQIQKATYQSEPTIAGSSASNNNLALTSKPWSETKYEGYIPSSSEKYIIDHLDQLGYDSEDDPSGCSIWMDENVTNAKIYNSLVSYGDELTRYTRAVQQFQPMNLNIHKHIQKK